MRQHTLNGRIVWHVDYISIKRSESEQILGVMLSLKLTVAEKEAEKKAEYKCQSFHE